MEVFDIPPELLATCCECVEGLLPAFWTVEWDTTIASQPFPEFWVMGPKLDEMFREFEDLLFLVAGAV